MPAIAPASREESRLRALRDLGLLDTPPSEAFDRFTRMASQLFKLPMSAISLTDHDRQWFKSRVGIDAEQVPRFKAPCDEIATTGEVMVVPDLLEDERYRDSPLANAGVRFYAGAPLMTREGYGLGSMAVLGLEPRTVTEAELGGLQDLAAMVMTQIELQHAFGRIDPASGLPNRTQLMEDLQDLARDEPDAERVAVLVDLIDTRQLGEARSVLGPSFVDDIVRFGKAAIEPHLSQASAIYQVGTTELFFLLKEPNGPALQEMLSDIKMSLAAFIDSGGIPVAAHAAIGIVPFRLGGMSPGDVLRKAFATALDARDAELKVEIHSAAKDAAHHRRFKILAEMREALLAPDQLSLLYQPRIEVRTGRCAGAEALLRWRHPELGAVPPGEFIPLVEQTALSRPLADWVLQRALAQIVSWKEEGVEVPVSINICAANLEEEDFAERLRLGLDRHGLPPQAIELEFTESALIRMRWRVLKQLEQIKALGITCAIDDFGIGYSSFSYLQNIPAQIIKIDRTFMSAVDCLARDRTLVKAMIAMAHQLDYRVVAEGVETQETYDFLAASGCDEVQGYFISRPLAPAAFQQWLAGWGGLGGRTRAA